MGQGLGGQVLTADDPTQFQLLDLPGDGWLVVGHGYQDHGHLAVKGSVDAVHADVGDEERSVVVPPPG